MSAAHLAPLDSCEVSISPRKRAELLYSLIMRRDLSSDSDVEGQLAENIPQTTTHTHVSSSAYAMHLPVCMI